MLLHYGNSKRTVGSLDNASKARELLNQEVHEIVAGGSKQSH